MNSKLDEIYDRIQALHIDPFGQDIRQVLEIMLELVAEVKRLDSELKHTANIASCFANGIQPD